ncbi:MAG: hypothetical protein WDZ70_00280 [Candidatus Paceibacterota bacterium]
MRRHLRHILPLFIGVLILSITPFNVAHAISLFDLSFPNFGAMMGEMILRLFGWLVWLGGVLLDTAIQYTVVDMAQFVNDITAIDLSWRVFRDFANIIFIFLLLYAAIATILRLSNFQTKQVVTRLVIVALLVNFSLFFTKAIVDVSNITALQFYQAIQIEDPRDDSRDLALSEVFMESLRLTTIYDVNTGSVNAQGSSDVLEPNNMTAITIIGSIFFLVAAFVFFAGAILFIIRFALLVLLMVIAPFAFVAWILPSTQEWFKKWWETLLKQALFAPIYLGITYLVVRIVTNPGFKQTLFEGGGSLAGDLSGATVGATTVVLAFGLVITLLIATLVIAQSMSLAGSKTVMQWGKSAQRWGREKVSRAPGTVARNTLGRAASKVSDSERFKDAAASNWVARTAFKSVKGVAGSSFDPRKGVGKGGYEAKLGEQVKSRQKFAESLGYNKKKVEPIEREKEAQEGVVGRYNERIEDLKDQVQDAKDIGDSSAQSQYERELRGAQRGLRRAKKKLEDRKAAVKEVKTARQSVLADKYASGHTPDTLFFKVPRKNKEAAEAIRKSIKKDKDTNEELKDFIEEKFKESKEE